MRVFLQNRFPEALLPVGQETQRWVAEPVGDGGEYDQFYYAMQAKSFDPPIPTTIDPLCYTLKIRRTGGAGIVFYLIGSYYGDESAQTTANEYLEFKKIVWPSLPNEATIVVTCSDDQHPALNFNEVFPTLSEIFILEGYWLASDPDTFVSVA
jgi:hypothetical protein